MADRVPRWWALCNQSGGQTKKGRPCQEPPLPSAEFPLHPCRARGFAHAGPHMWLRGDGPVSDVGSKVTAGPFEEWRPRNIEWVRRAGCW